MDKAFPVPVHCFVAEGSDEGHERTARDLDAEMLALSIDRPPGAPVGRPCSSRRSGGIDARRPISFVPPSRGFAQ